MAEQASLLRRRERRARAPSSSVRPTSWSSAAASSRSAAQPRMELRGLAADRRDADRVLEQAARVAVVAVGGRGQLAQRRRGAARRRRSGRRAVARPGCAISPARNSRKPSSSSASRRSAGASAAGSVSAAVSSERTSSWSRSRKRSTRPSTRTASPSAKRASSSSTSCQTRASMRPLGSTSSSARYGAPAARPQPALARDRVDALDDPVLGEVGDGRSRGRSLGPSAGWYVAAHGRRQPVPRAPLRRGEAGPLDALVAPPYDVIGPDERARAARAQPAQRRPPDAARLGGRAPRAPRATGATRACSRREPEPASGRSQQDYVGPDGVARTRTGSSASLRVEPYEQRVVLPHERTHRGPKEGRLRLLRAVRVQLEPIFLLYDGRAAVRRARARAGPRASRARALWRLEADGDRRGVRRPAAPDRRRPPPLRDGARLPRRGRHRGERAACSSCSSRRDDPGLTIFPTHRVFAGRARCSSPNGAGDDAEAALRRLEAVPVERAAACR